MMRLLYPTLTIAVAIGISPAGAQTGGNDSSKTLTMVGVVKKVSASSLTVDTGKNEYVVVANSSTRVLVARGGPGGSQVQDLVYRVPDPNRVPTAEIKAGDQVSVKYRQSGSTKTAVEVEVLQQRAKK